MDRCSREREEEHLHTGGDHGAGEEALKGDLLQGSPGGVDDALPEIQCYSEADKATFPLIFIIKLLVNVEI